MATRLCFFVLTMLLTRGLTPEIARQVAVWNVGQGQWVTLLNEDGCWHFDIGGEFAPWSEIMKLCRARKNRVTLSHWDWDHVGLVGRARFYLPNICLVLPPQGLSSERKKRQLAGLEPCTEDVPFTFWNGSLAKSANASSRVIMWENILLPGDSSRDQEKLWLDRLPVSKARILVLGHHGSATSTGQELLKSLVGLKLAIASARFRRYGHPHPRVQLDLSKKGVPLLRTEDWGSIRMEL